MNYKEINKAINEDYLTECDLCGRLFNHTASDCQGYSCRDVKNKIMDIAYKEGYSRGYDSGYDASCMCLGSNYKEWYAKDKNDEPTFIGDTVELSNGEQVIVQGLSSNGIFAVPKGDGYIHFENEYFEKVIPDTKESITCDMANIFGIHYDEAEILYDRIADCVKAELGDA